MFSKMMFVGYGMSKSVSKTVEIIGREGRESWNAVNDKSVKPSVCVCVCVLNCEELLKHDMNALYAFNTKTNLLHWLTLC